MKLSQGTQEWFKARYGQATQVQVESWAALESGQNILISAPTGSGKTLAAFLWFIDKLIQEGRSGTNNPRIKILYISPLRALNNDIAKNLMEPLAALGGDHGPQVAIRSGDSSPRDRRQLLVHPPEILVTTPESLNILLTTKPGRGVLSGVEAVIVDEIHHVIGSKRGTHLVLGLERLVGIAGEYRRVGISATVKPLMLAASFLGGFDSQGKPRPVEIIAPPGKKNYDISLLPSASRSGDGPWILPAERIAERVLQNTTTLVFTNSRRVAERIALLVNEKLGERLAWPHHGSLSRELRLGVEEALKAGTLRCVVATSTLELGIDIGSIDEVILLQAPGVLSSAAQRMGRGGHHVGGVARVLCVPLIPLDILYFSIMIKGVRAGEVEETKIPHAPLDVLIQVVLAELLAKPQTKEDLFETLHRAYPFASMSLDFLQGALEILEGIWTNTGIKELKARIALDINTGVYTPRQGVVLELWSSGGTIPDRGLYDLRLAQDNSKLGQLDEEFVWERRVGERFSLGNQTWKITAIEDNKVLVEPSSRPAQFTPFWRAEAQGRDSYTQAVLVDVLSALPKIPQHSQVDLVLSQKLPECDPQARSILATYLCRQMDHCKAPLPHGTHLVLEHTKLDKNQGGLGYSILHTMAGLAINTTISFGLKTYLGDLGVFESLDMIPTDNALLMVSPGTVLTEVLHTAIYRYARLSPRDRRSLVDRALGASSLFGQGFRENAGRALLISRGGFGKRLPLWLSRRKTKNLLLALKDKATFPLVEETWMEVFQENLDWENTERILEGLILGQVDLVETSTPSPSPMATDLMWHLGNIVIYENDTPSTAVTLGGPNPEEEDGEARAALLLETITKETQDRWLNLLYPRNREDQPENELGWVFFCIDAILVPRKIWDSLLEHPLEKLPPGLQTTTLPGANQAVIIHDRTLETLGTGHLLTWLARCGIWEARDLKDIWGDLVDLAELASPLPSPRNPGTVFYHLETLEAMVRWQKHSASLSIVTRTLKDLAVDMAQLHGHLRRAEDSQQGMEEVLWKLVGLPLVASTLEHYLLPSRLGTKAGHDFKAQIHEALVSSNLGWTGWGPRNMVIVPIQGLPGLMAQDDTSKVDSGLGSMFDQGAFDFWTLQTKLTMQSHDLETYLWGLVQEGRASNDDVETLRLGIREGFAPPKHPVQVGGARTRRMPSYRTWNQGKPSRGRWFLLGSHGLSQDPLERQEQLESMVYLLLDRWPVLCKDLVSREAYSGLWKEISPVLQRLELAGELVAARYYQGLSMPQYCAREAVASFGRGPSTIGQTDSPWWIHCADPASVSGLDPQVIPRSSNGILLYKESTLCAWTTKELSYLWLDAGCSIDLGEILGTYLELCRLALNRPMDPPASIHLVQIDGLASNEHPLAEDLIRAGFKPDLKTLRLWRW